MPAPTIRRLVLAFLSNTLLAGGVTAAPTLGFHEDWNAPPSTSTWGGGATTTNPGTGGLGGGADGYLNVSRISPGSLGAVSFGPEYQGDWTAAGITQLRMWLDDVGTDESLEIHVAIGNGTNFWEYLPRSLPPNGGWGEYVADLTNPEAWTQILGTGTFAQALQAVDRVLVRHDLAPYMQTPDPIVGDFGLDHVLLTDGIVGVESSTLAVRHPVELAPPFPNPARGPVALAITQPEPAPLRIEILDAAGRRVRSISLPAAGAGPRLWIWDGRDDRGARAAPGAYRVRASGPSGGMSRPLVRID